MINSRCVMRWEFKSADKRGGLHLRIFSIYIRIYDRYDIGA